MKKIIMMKGLPASGKSTLARQLCLDSPGQYKITNKDQLRDMMDAGKWSRDNEKFVLFVRDFIIVEALKSGKHVIVDDTNLAPKHEDRLRQLAAANGAMFEIVDFTHVSIETCIERDLKRFSSVGEKVIRDMHRQFLAPKPPVIERNPSLPYCVICDIDGTVALMDGRSPYDYSLVHTDAPNAPVIRAVHALAKLEYRIIFVSGRKAECRKSTEEWLLRYVGFFSPLFMREDGDNRDDRIIKEEIYRREIEGRYNVLLVIDDRRKVVERWRELGLTCLQVAEGEF